MRDRRTANGSMQQAAGDHSRRRAATPHPPVPALGEGPERAWARRFVAKIVIVGIARPELCKRSFGIICRARGAGSEGRRSCDALLHEAHAEAGRALEQADSAMYVRKAQRRHET